MAAASAPASTSPRACDLRLASADAFFQVAEVDVAITADLGTLQRLGYLIPQGVLRELTYTGRRMAPEEAARSASSTGSADAMPRRRRPRAGPGRSPPSRRSRSPAPSAASTTAAAGPVEEGLRDVATRGTPRPWSAPISPRRCGHGSASTRPASARSTTRPPPPALRPMFRDATGAQKMRLFPKS